ncbi:MFS transporter [Micromonospora aurantiaca (nom. illeg.)]|uniref:MFS transporter n=1 Tax=Micromonospora aurantiaca (nom. illeg.) TaxID=47850 RepID=UPI0037B6B493
MVGVVARRARVAVTVLFAVNGAAYAVVVPWYPQVQDAGQVSAAGWGVALAGYPVGTLAAGLPAGWLVRRCGSAWPLCIGIVALAAVNATFALVDGLWGLLLVFGVLGCLDAVIEVSASVQALAVQARYRRWLLNSCHAAWSAGAIGGGLLGAVAVGGGLPLRVFLPAVAAGVAVLVAALRPLLLPDDHRSPDAPPGSSRAGGEVGPSAGERQRRYRVLLVLGGIAACGAFVEDVPASWGAIWLDDGVHAAAGLAGGAVVAAQAAMAAGRAVGDRLSDRFGSRLVVRAGALLAAGGMTSAVAWPSVTSVLAASAVCGLGVAVVIPAAVDRAGTLSQAASAVTVLSMMQRVGPLASPLAIGVLAEHVSLRAALLTVPAVAAGLWVLAQVLPGPPALRRSPPPSVPGPAAADTARAPGTGPARLPSPRTRGRPPAVPADRRRHPGGER